MQEFAFSFKLNLPYPGFLSGQVGFPKKTRPIVPSFLYLLFIYMG